MSLVVDGLSGQGFAPVDGFGSAGELSSRVPGFGEAGFDFTQGDPKIGIGPNGAYLNWIDGQPQMDQGLENSVLIGLFTSPGWAGNKFLAGDEQIGSNFEISAHGPITRSKLSEIEQEAVLALSGPLYEVSAGASNPTGHRLDVTIGLRPPGADMSLVVLSRNGRNWLNQAAGL